MVGNPPQVVHTLQLLQRPTNKHTYKIEHSFDMKRNKSVLHLLVSTLSLHTVLQGEDRPSQQAFSGPSDEVMPEKHIKSFVKGTCPEKDLIARCNFSQTSNCLPMIQELLVQGVFSYPQEPYPLTTLAIPLHNYIHPTWLSSVLS